MIKQQNNMQQHTKNHNNNSDLVSRTIKLRPRYTGQMKQK